MKSLARQDGIEASPTRRRRNLYLLRADRQETGQARAARGVNVVELSYIVISLSPAAACCCNPFSARCVHFTARCLSSGLVARVSGLRKCVWLRSTFKAGCFPRLGAAGTRSRVRWRSCVGHPTKASVGEANGRYRPLRTRIRACIAGRPGPCSISSRGRFLVRAGRKQETCGAAGSFSADGVLSN